MTFTKFAIHVQIGLVVWEKKKDEKKTQLMAGQEETSCI